MCLVGVSPILSQYTVGIYTITLFELLLLVVCIIVFLFSRSRNESARIQIKEFLLTIPKLFFPFYIILVASYFLFKGSSFEEFCRTLRVAYYYLFCVFITKNQSIGMLRYATYGAMFVSIFLIIQYILFKSIGYFLPGYINLLPVAREEVMAFTDVVNRYSESKDVPYWVRFRSVLGEPSKIGLYVGLVYYCLAAAGQRLMSFKMVLLLCGLILSVSGVAFVMLLYTGFYILFIEKNLKTKILYLVCSTPLVIFLLYKFPIILDLQKRIIVRLNAYLVDQNISFFGVGYSKDLLVSWAPSLWRVFNAFGLLGLSMLLIYFLSKMKFIKKNIYSLILIFLIGFACEVLLSYWIIIWYALLFKNEKEMVICKYT